MTQFERHQDRMVQYAVNRANGRKPWDNGKPRSPKPQKPAEPLRDFDDSTWKATPEVLTLLKKHEAREQNLKNVLQRIGDMIDAEKNGADANELKYGGQLTIVDRYLQSSYSSLNPQKRYSMIEEGRGTNGDCHSRKTTYRRYKFGKGNVGRRGWLLKGFEQSASGEHQ